MMDQKFPTGWLSLPLGEVAIFQNGFAFKSGNYQESGAFVIRIGNVQSDGISFSNPAYIDIQALGAERFELSKGDMLISLTGNVGRLAIIKHEHLPAVLNQRVARVLPIRFIDNSFIYYLIRSGLVQKEIFKSAKGAAQLNVSTKDLSIISVPLPPLAEQKVIADKLDTMLAKVDNTKARLERILEMLKRFRQSVLAAAVGGRLLKKLSSTSWHETTVGEIAIDIRYGTSRKCSESSGSTPVFRIPNIGDGLVIQDNLKFADFESKEIDKLRLISGDLLLIRSNGSLDLVGKTALVRERDSGFLFAGYLIRLRLDVEIAIPEYISIFLQSPEARAAIEEKAKSTSGVNNINSKELAGLCLKLPTVDKQAEIVRRIDQFFAYADTVERQVNNALERVSQLTQSILAKAFRGELTAQWREDNPELISGENSAEALLERIKEERAAQAPKKRTRKKAKA